MVLGCLEPSVPVCRCSVHAPAGDHSGADHLVAEPTTKGIGEDGRESRPRVSVLARVCETSPYHNHLRLDCVGECLELLAGSGHVQSVSVQWNLHDF